MFQLLDYIVRIIAICGVIPFGFLGMFLSIMAGDSGTLESKIFAIVMLGAVVGLILLISMSALMPTTSISKLPKLLRNIIVVRLPAYAFLLPSIWFLWNVWIKHRI